MVKLIFDTEKEDITLDTSELGLEEMEKLLLDMSDMSKELIKKLLEELAEKVMKLIPTKQQDLLLDILIQSCGANNGIIDNQCISAYEDVCKHLEQQGLLTKINDRIYQVKKVKNGNK